MSIARAFRLLVLLMLMSSPIVAPAQDIAVGDRVAVSAASTKVMAGEAVLGNIAKGTTFAVEQVNGSWLLGSVNIGEKKVNGWIKSADVTRATANRSGNPDALGTDMPRTPRQGASSRVKSDAEKFQQSQEMFRRMLPRYSPKSEFPATMYGFLPIRQGFPESIPANANYITALTSSSELMWTGQPFDPSTAREPETTRLLQTLSPNMDLDSVLDRLRKRIQEANDSNLTTGSVSLLVLKEVHPDLPVLLEKMSRRMFTDVNEIAEDRYQQLIAQRGVDNPQTMTSLAWLFYIRRMHAGLEVETTHHRMLDWAKKKFGDGHPLTSRAWNNLALIRHDRGDFEAARRLLFHALSLRADKPVAADVPLLLINLARVLETEGRQSESRRCSETARAASRALPKEIRTLVAQSYLNEFADPRIPETGGSPFYMRSGLSYRPAIFNFIGYGGSTMARSEGVETEKSEFDALNMTAIIGGADRNAHRYVPYMNAGAHFSRVRNFAAAERFQRKAIELSRAQFESGSDQELKSRIAMCYQSLGMTLETIGNHEAAVEAYGEGIKVQRPLWEQMLKKAQADISAGRGQFVFVLDQTYVPLLMLHAKLHAELGRLEDAERLYREALTEAKKPTAISKNPQTAMYSYVPQCEAELAGVLLRRGKTQEAESLFRAILTANYQKWPFNSWHVLSTFPSLIDLATIFEAKGTPEDSVRAAQMFHDAYLFMSKGADSSNSRGADQTLINYARVLQRSGHHAEKSQILQTAIAGIESQRRLVGGDEINRARYFSELTKHDPYSLLAQLQVEVGENFVDHFGVGEFGPKAAFDTLEQGRGRALLDLMSRGGGDVSSTAMAFARNQNDQALIQRVTQLRTQEQTARQQVAQIIERGAAAASNTNAVAQLQAELQKARESEIQAKRDLFDIAKEVLEKDSLKPLTAQEAAKSLQPGEAILVYDIGQDRSARLTVWPDGKVDGEFLKWPDDKPVAEKELAMSIADFFQDVSREESGNSNTTTPTKAYAPDELRQALLPNALLEKLKSCNRLFVVGDGPLHRLPFEPLFIDEEGKQVLVDQLPPIVYGPSATILLHSRNPPKTERKSRLELVALGDPQFNRETATASSKTPTTENAAAMIRTRSLSRFGTLTPLPGTRAEIDIIRQTLAASGKEGESQVKVLSGPDATISNLFRDVNQPRFLHLATHGLAEGGRKAYDSALALAAPESVTPDDTGFLRLSDLLAQWGGKLNGTELVVLSACRTARGEMESGDGFVALTWGFLFAGSQNVVASLWEVDDTATALLMSRLYENLLGNFREPRTIAGSSYSAGSPLPRAVALQEAKTWLRNLNRDQAETTVKALLKQAPQLPPGDRPYADPYYWGAFLMFGGEDN